MEDGVMEVKEGEEVELQCESQGGRPPAEIQWWDWEGRRIVSHVTEHVRRMEDRKTFKIVSTLMFVPKHPISVKCTVSNDAFPVMKESDILEIEFKAAPELELKTVLEGESFLIECNSHRSSFSSYKWFINENEIVSENSKTLRIDNFVAAYDSSVIKCEGVDKLGNLTLLTKTKLQLGSANEPLVLASGKVKGIKKTERKSKSDKNSKGKTIFTCIAEENISVEPSYVWIKGKLVKSVVAENEENRQIKCKVVPSGYTKLNKMNQEMKDISKMFKKLSRSLNQILTPKK
jgi:hypothetical protein